MRVEIARIRFPIDVDVLADLVTTLEVEPDWTDLRVKHAAILDGVQWLVITAEVNQ